MRWLLSSSSKGLLRPLLLYRSCYNTPSPFCPSLRAQSTSSKKTSGGAERAEERSSDHAPVTNDPPPASTAGMASSGKASSQSDDQRVEAMLHGVSGDDKVLEASLLPEDGDRVRAHRTASNDGTHMSHVTCMHAQRMRLCVRPLIRHCCVKHWSYMPLHRSAPVVDHI